MLDLRTMKSRPRRDSLTPSRLHRTSSAGAFEMQMRSIPRGSWKRRVGRGALGDVPEKSTCPRVARVRSSRGRSVRVLVLVAGAGLSLSLASCGSSSPSKPYQQGWDRAVTSPGYDCNTVPRGIASASDWTKGCQTGQGFLNAHDTKGQYPTPTPTTYPGDP